MDGIIRRNTADRKPPPWQSLELGPEHIETAVGYFNMSNIFLARVAPGIALSNRDGGCFGKFFWWHAVNEKGLKVM